MYFYPILIDAFNFLPNVLQNMLTVLMVNNNMECGYIKPYLRACGSKNDYCKETFLVLVNLLRNLLNEIKAPNSARHIVITVILKLYLTGLIKMP